MASSVVMEYPLWKSNKMSFVLLFIEMGTGIEIRLGFAYRDDDNDPL